jgi:hypothetical protein
MTKALTAGLESNPDIAAMEGLEFAGSLPHGPTRTEALKQAGLSATGQINVVLHLRTADQGRVDSRGNGRLPSEP